MSTLKTLTAAVASAVLLSSAASAAGLGKLTVLSALGQPLRAEIELTSVGADEANGLAAKLASAEAYRSANIEFNPSLLALRFSVEQRGGRQFIRITSPQPMNEPFVDLLLELSWNNGRLVREYTFLLDPAELRSTQSAQVAAANGRTPRTAATPAAESGAAPAAAATRPQRAARADEGASASEAPSRYRVKPGDTLGRVAGRLKPVDVSLDMMLVALYRANPDAFIGNNMNRLKSGQILSVPAGESLRGQDRGEAHGTVVAHAADFNAYRAKLAGQVATSAPARESAAGQSATGRVTAKVEERPTAANEAADRLRLSKATPAKPGASGAATTAEDAIAKEKELTDAQQRVKELEKNVNDLEKIVTVKSGVGAAATQRAGEAPAAAAPAAAAPAAATDAAPAIAAAPAPAAPVKPAPKATAPAAPAEPGLLDTLMDNIVYLGAGALVLGLAALGIAQRRKQKPLPKAAPATTILGSAAQPSPSLFAKTGGQRIDTHDSVFNSSFAPSASQLDTNEVDPLAEAELYLAYNFDTQAEDILKEALRNDPMRHPVRLKLLEIYAARKDVRAFGTQATELYSLTGGKGEEWAQAAALGHTLDPANPMYAQSAGVADAGAAAAVAAGAGVAAAAVADNGPQSLLSQQLEQAFRNRSDEQEVIEPVSTVDAVTGAPLDTGFLLDDARADADTTVLPQFEEAVAKAHANANSEMAVDPDDNMLDFDLGGLSFEPEAPLDAPASPAAATDLTFDMAPFAPLEPASGTPVIDPASSSADDLAFDMEFGADSAHAATATPADDAFVLDLSKHNAGTDLDMAGLASEFDLPQTAATPAANTSDALFDAADFDLSDATPAPAPQPEPVFDFGDTDFDLSTPATEAAPLQADKDEFETADFRHHAAPAATHGFALERVMPVQAPVTQFNMSVLDLELPQRSSDLNDLSDLTAEPAAPAVEPAAPAVEPAAPAVEQLAAPDVETAAAPQQAAAELTPAQMEMETKLDLAVAYQEIGDKEGARELLDEVIKGGNVEQASRASAMRAQLV